MGYSVYGVIKDEAGNKLDGVTVLPYFQKVDSGSDDSRWSTEKYTSDANGYYTYSCEDDNILGSEGIYKKTSDKFYTAYMLGGGENIDSLDLTDAVFHQHVIPNDDDLEINITMEPKRVPIIDSYSFPDATLTQHNYTMTEDSYTNTSWLEHDYGEDTSQKLTYDNVAMFDGHQLIDTTYTWHEIEDREITNNTNDSYSFLASGNYTLKMRVKEKWDTFTEVSKDITIKYNEPIMDFSWTPTETNDWDGSKIKGQELITFHNDTTCLDDRLSDPYYYKWIIEDENQDGSDNTQTIDAEYADEPTHAFQSEGTKKITLICYWNDGFDDLEVQDVQYIDIYPFTIVPEFTWDAEPRNRNQDVTFDPANTSGDTDKISRYDWTMEDNYPAPDTDLYTFDVDETSLFDEGSSDNTQSVDNAYDIGDTEKPVVKFHSLDTKQVTVVITYSDGWKDVTDTITHTVTPVKYDVTPSFTISDVAPQGRAVQVDCTNTSSEYSQDGFDIGYTIDWSTDDEYKACNLDNPNPGADTDNSETNLDLDKDTLLSHNYQNTDEHTVELTIRYDDGYQMQTKRISHTLTPIVYEGLEAKFSWDITPTDRTQVVTFTNESTDDDNRFRSYSWTIEDHYNKWNPDSSDYGNDIVDNTQTISHDTDKDLQPTHKFQDNTDENVTMTYYYDDGYCEREVHLTKVVTKMDYLLTPVIANNTETIGKMEVLYTNDSTGDTSRELDEKWTFNDVEFGTDNDVITIRDDEQVRADQAFTWQTPSRKPYTAIDGATSSNLNKNVHLQVRIDTGWRDDTDDATIGEDNTSGNGGVVYYETDRDFEATPFELSSAITYETNVEGYTH